MEQIEKYNYRMEIQTIIDNVDDLKKQYSIDGKPVFDYCIYKPEDLDVVKSEMENLIKNSDVKSLKSWQFQSQGHSVFPGILANKLYKLNFYCRYGNLNQYEETMNEEFIIWQGTIEKRFRDLGFVLHGEYYEKKLEHLVKVKVIYAEDAIKIEIYSDSSECLYDEHLFEWIRGFTNFSVFFDILVEYIREKFDEINNIQQEVPDYPAEEFAKFKESRLPDNYKAVVVYRDCLRSRNYNGVKDTYFVMLIGVDDDNNENLIDVQICNKTIGRQDWIDIFQNLRHRGINDINIVRSYPYRSLKPALLQVYRKTLFCSGMDYFVDYILRNINSLTYKEKCRNDFMRLYDIPEELEAVNEFNRLVEKRESNYPGFGYISVSDSKKKDVITMFKFTPAFRKKIRCLDTEKYTRKICDDYNRNGKIFRNEEELLITLHSLS